MKNTFFTLAVAFFAVAWTNAAVGEPHSGRIRPHPPLGNNPHPVIWGGQQVRPASPAPQPPAGRSAHHHGPRHGYNHSYYFVRRYYPYPGYVYGYDPYYGYGYPYPYAYLPLYLSAEALYGPRAVQRFMGVADGFQPRPDANIIAPPAGGNVEADAPEPKKAVERATNTQANALAWRFIGFGDAQFAAQKFADANQRYRKASQSAPQLADAWFRQGFALSAIGRYDLAVGAINRGLKINPNWAKSGFDLKELYGPDELAKDARLDVLAQAAADKPNDANLLFLVGVHLHFDGQAEQAEQFFQRAKELAGDDAEHIRTFMSK